MIRHYRKQNTGNRYGQNRRGYTLLELLLALALSVIVIGAIGTAIQVYMIALTKQQARIERKQVVRAIFMMISNDLRAGIQYKAADYSGLETLVQTRQLQINQAAAALDPDAEPVDESAEPEDSGIIDEEEVSFRPTLLGASNVIMIDISRLPRLDQYNPLVAAPDLDMNTPSDVKSLAYFASLTEGGIEEQLEFAESRAPGGLYRRELDRAVANYLGDISIVDRPDQFSRLIAHEIAEIGFRYWDGEAWLSDWDSEEEGAFPSAIEVTLVIDAERSAAQTQSYTYSGREGETSETFVSVVHLPVTDLPESEEE